MSMDNDEVHVAKTPLNQVVETLSSSKKVFWKPLMERKFLDLLHEQVALGRKAEGGFKKEAWTAIERKFNAELHMNLTRDNFKNKMKTWKIGYRIMKELKNTSGFAWNKLTQSMDAKDSVWEELLKVTCPFKCLALLKSKFITMIVK